MFNRLVNKNDYCSPYHCGSSLAFIYIYFFLIKYFR